MRHIIPIVLLIVFVFCSVNLQAYDQDTVFIADFQTSSLEDWSVTLGEWDIDEGHYCTISCSS